MSSDHTAFIAAICAAPADDLPRLVFADWLDENEWGSGFGLRWQVATAAVCKAPADDGPRLAAAGLCEAWGRAGRGEFIRLGCELRTMTTSLPHAAMMADSLARLGRLGTKSARLHRLLAENGTQWLCELGIEPTKEMVSWPWSRGFVNEFRGTAESWLAHHEKLCWCWGPCWRCSGTGTVPLRGGCPHCDHGRVPPPMPCPKCGGKLGHICIDGERRHTPANAMARKEYDDTYGQTWRAESWTTWRECPDCRSPDGKPTGRVPRPCPATAQPIERVRLTGSIDQVTWGAEIRPMGGEFTDARWPGIAFELPERTGTIGSSSETAFEAGRRVGMERNQRVMDAFLNPVAESELPVSTHTITIMSRERPAALNSGPLFDQATAEAGHVAHALGVRFRFDRAEAREFIGGGHWEITYTFRPTR